jgi:tetratricopeptide (TPR) repeat protein
MMSPRLLALTAVCCLATYAGQQPGQAAYNNAALALHLNGQLNEAEQLYRKSLTLAQADTPEYATVLNNLGQLELTRGHLSEADRYCSAALDTYRHIGMRTHAAAAPVHANLGIIRKDQKRWAESERYLLQALAIDIKHHGRNHPTVATDWSNLGVLMWSRGRIEPALQMFLLTARIRERALGRDSKEYAMALVTLAKVCEMQGYSAEAIAYLRHAKPSLERALGPEHASVQTVRKVYDSASANLFLPASSNPSSVN